MTSNSHGASSKLAASVLLIWCPRSGVERRFDLGAAQVLESRSRGAERGNATSVQSVKPMRLGSTLEASCGPRPSVAVDLAGFASLFFMACVRSESQLRMFRGGRGRGPRTARR